MNDRIHGPLSKHIPNINEYIKKAWTRWKKETERLAEKMGLPERKD